MSWIQEDGNRVKGGNFSEIVSFGDIIVLGVLGTAVGSAIDQAGLKNFAGTILLDATNPLDFSKGMPPRNARRIQSSINWLTSRAEAPDASVVKCFNTVPHSQFFHPKHSEAQMLICGNDKGAKNSATSILKQFGWAGSIDIGGIESARYNEWLVPLWVRPALAVESFDSMFISAK